MNRHLTAIAQASGVIVSSCLASVLAKLALREVSPFTFVWLQIAIGGSLLTLYTFGWRRERIPKGLGWEVWAYILWIGSPWSGCCSCSRSTGCRRPPMRTWSISPAS